MFPFIFTQPEALWGLILCVLPTVMYWFRRRQVTVIPWGAMRFLQAALEKVRRKNQWRDFAVLFLQTFAILCVVLAAAGMSLRSELTALSDSKSSSNLWLLDISESMNAHLNGKETRLEAAEKIVPKGQTVIQVSDWETLPELPEHAISSVTLLSDSPADPAFPAFLERLAAKTPRAAHRLVSVFTPVSNLSVSGLELAQTPALAGQKQTVCLTVRNDSDSACDSVQAELTLEKKDAKNGVLTLKKGEKWLKLPARSEARARWDVTFPEAGEFHVTASLKNRDDFPSDDFRELKVQVKETARFLIAESFESVKNSSEVSRTEAAPNFLAALSALFSARCPEVPVEKILRVDSVHDMNFSSLDLTAYDAVFLLNVPFFTETEAGNLRSYVQNGGVLWFFPGSQTKDETFEPLADFLPAVSAGKMKVQPEREAKQERTARLVTPKIPATPHRVTEIFVQNPKSGLENAPVFQWFGLKPAPNSSVVLELSTGEPLLVSRDFGLGRTAIAAIPADSRASVLPLLPVWVPLVDQTLHFLTSASETEPGLNCPAAETRWLNAACEPAAIPLSWEFQTFSPTEEGERVLGERFLVSVLYALAAGAIFVASLFGKW